MIDWGVNLDGIRVMDEIDAAIFAGVIPDNWFAKNADKVIFEPDHIIANAGEVSEAEVMPGLYFLIKDGRIDYVGKAKNLNQRVVYHQQRARCGQEPKFDACFLIQPFPNLVLDSLEAFYIAWIKPPRNRAYPPCYGLTRKMRALIK